MIRQATLGAQLNPATWDNAGQQSWDKRATQRLIASARADREEGSARWGFHDPAPLFRQMEQSGGMKSFASDCGKSVELVGDSLANFMPKNGELTLFMAVGVFPLFFTCGRGRGAVGKQRKQG